MEKNKSEILSVFGAKVSKDGKKLVLSLISGENESKKYYNACIKLDNSQKTTAEIEEDGKHANIRVVMLEDKTKNDNEDDLPF